MHYMHSESRANHTLAEPLFAAVAPQDNHQYELRHKAVIDRYGRRNAILGEPSMPEEATLSVAVGRGLLSRISRQPPAPALPHRPGRR